MTEIQFHLKHTGILWALVRILSITICSWTLGKIYIYRFIDMWVKGYKMHVGAPVWKSVSVHVFISTCVFIQARRDEFFPSGAFPGMRIFQSQWDSSGLVLNARSDGDPGWKHCWFHHSCLLWLRWQPGGEGCDKWGTESRGNLAPHAPSDSPGMEEPSQEGSHKNTGWDQPGFWVAGVFLVFFGCSSWSVVVAWLGIGARCAASAPCSKGSLFQRVFLLIPRLIFPVQPLSSHTTSLEPLEGQARVENISKGHQHRPCLGIQSSEGRIVESKDVDFVHL